MSNRKTKDYRNINGIFFVYNEDESIDVFNRWDSEREFIISFKNEKDLLDKLKVADIKDIDAFNITMYQLSKENWNERTSNI